MNTNEIVDQQNKRAKREGAVGKLTTAEWEAILDANGGACADCGSVDDICMDHVIPLSKGGTHTLYNVQPLCRSCNSSKRNRIDNLQDAILDDFLRRYAANDNEWLRLSPGESRNLFDALLYRVKIAEGACAKLHAEVDALRTDKEVRSASASSMGRSTSERKTAANRAKANLPPKPGSRPRGRPRKQPANDAGKE